MLSDALKMQNKNIQKVSEKHINHDNTKINNQNM